MMIFLPFSHPVKCARVLDKRRLWKQFLEATQIITTLEFLLKYPDGINPETGKKRGWIHHPAVIMFIGHIAFLKWYANCMYDEFSARGGKTKMSKYSDADEPDMKPWFLGWDAFHASHRNSLRRKDTEHYTPLFSSYNDPHQDDYIWPSKFINRA